MLTDLKSFKLHIQMLEIINIIIYVVIILSTTIVSLLIFKKFLYAMIGFLIATLIGYIIYAIIQLKADYYKLQIDIYDKLAENNKE